MNVTELAHWRYRVKALTIDKDEYQRVVSDAKQVDPGIWFDVFDLFGIPRDPSFKEMLAIIEEGLRVAQYLLEEAKYMCELGELTL